MNWLLKVSSASLGAEISLTAVIQALLRESTALLNAVFAEKPLSRECLEVLRLGYRFRFGSREQKAISLGKKQGMEVWRRRCMEKIKALWLTMRTKAHWQPPTYSLVALVSCLKTKSLVKP
jgi:hypothetical protein